MTQKLNDDYMETLTVDEIVENEDGTATIKMTMTDDVQNTLIRSGYQDLIEEMKMQDKVGVFEPPANFSIEAKTIEMSDEEAQMLLELSVRNALTRGMNLGVKKFDESWDDFFAKAPANDLDDNT
jgi:hypothetical protein